MELYHNPANLFVAGFLGAPSMNFLPITVQSQSGDSVAVSSALLGQTTVPRQGRSFDVGAPATLGIRPQYLTPSDTGALRGTVCVSERLGTETVVELAMEDGTKLMAALAQDVVLTLGETVAFDFDGAQAHVFAETL